MTDLPICYDCGKPRRPATFVLVRDEERPVCHTCQQLYEDDQQHELEYARDE